MATTGEVRFASMLKGVIKEWDSIDFFTSESFIKQTYVKTRELIVDGKFLLPESKKRAIILAKVGEAAEYFTKQWKGASGDRSGYKIAPEVIEKLKFVLSLMDIPIDEIQATIPAAQIPREPAANIPVPPPSPAMTQPSSIKPSEAPATEKKTMEQEKEEKKKGFFATTGVKLAAGGGVAALLAAIFFFTRKKGGGGGSSGGKGQYQ